MRKQIKFFFVLLVNMILMSAFGGKLKPAVIIFDAADTLVKYDKNYPVLLDKAAQAKGWEVKPNSRQVLGEVIQRHPEFLKAIDRAHDVKNIKEDLPIWMVVMQDWCKSMGYLSGQKEVGDFLTKAMGIGRSIDSPFFTLFDKVDEVLKKLKSSGYRLGILSNWDSSLRDLLKKYRIEDYFESIIISGEIGIDKPNPKIFEKALDDLKVDKKNVIYVGDTLSDDVYGAKSAGIQPVWANYKNQPLPEDLADVVVISSIEDLLNKVEISSN